MTRRLGLVTALLILVAVLSTAASAATTPFASAIYSYDQVAHNAQGARTSAAYGSARIDARAPTNPAPRSANQRVADFLAAKGADDAFHYTSRKALQSIETEGLRRGSYVTSNGNLSPLQAQIDLALPPNHGLRDAVVRVDLAGLRRAGYEIPAFRQVPRKFNMPGGGDEIQFPSSIPPQFVQVVRP